MRIAVVGVGLIGGSIGLAARTRLGAEVTGHDCSPAALRTALEMGALDEARPSVADAVRGADAVFVAVPVGGLAEVVRAALGAAGAECVVSDVGSTKRVLVSMIDDQRFVGGHPLAGAETSGVEHARGDLFDGATWYLTPTPATSGVLYERLHRLVHGLGARPAAIDAALHDRVVAAVSHLPHVLANVLVSQAAERLRAGGERLAATGPSFRDATRVAGAPTSLWGDIYLSNADSVAGEIEATIARLQEIRGALVTGDARAIAAWNDAAAEDRHRLLEATLAAGPLFELRAAVPNRPGVVARVALRLGEAGVNIADMALYPAPDMSEGVVALWVAGAEAAELAQRLLEDLGFPVARP